MQQGNRKGMLHLPDRQLWIQQCRQISYHCSTTSIKINRPYPQLDRVTKYEQRLCTIIAYITSQRNSQALQLIKQMLTRKDSYKLSKNYLFYGFGNKQNLNGYSYLYLFVQHIFSQKGKCKNLFDLLGITFMIQTLTNQIKPQEALEYYTFLERLIPGSEQILIGKGNIYYNSQQYLKAEQEYQKALLKTMQKPLIYEYLAWIKCQAFGMYSQALKYANQSLQKYNRNINAMYLKAITTPNPSDGLQILEKIRRYNPSFQKLYYAKIWHHIGDHNKIIQLCDTALSYNPNYLKAYFMKARHSDTLKEQTMYEEALDFYSDMYELWYQLAERYKEEENYEQAKLHYKRCLELNKYHFPALKGLAQIQELNSQQKNENLKESIGFYQKYIQLNIYDREVFNALGRLQYSLGNYQLSKNYFERAGLVF